MERRHLEFLSNYNYLKNNNHKVLCVLAVRGDNPELERLIQQDIIGLPANITPLILKSDNWGMCVGALWDTWKYLETSNITADYVWAMEDDWFYNHWPERIRVLETENIVYLGMFSTISFDNTLGNEPYYRETIRNRYKSADNDERFWVPGSQRRWTDGGGYFLKYESLKRIENKMGCFTKAPRDKFSYGEHGITFGEVGFPCELWANGFRFRAFTDLSYEGERCQWIDPTQATNWLPKGFTEDDTSWAFEYCPRKSRGAIVL